MGRTLLGSKILVGISVFIFSIVLALGSANLVRHAFADPGDPTVTDDVDRWTDLTLTSTHIAPIVAEDDTGVLNVMYRLNGGSWTSCAAEDGSYGETTEEALCTITGLTEGSNFIEFLATDIDENDTPPGSYLETYISRESAPDGDIIFYTSLYDSEDIYEELGYGTFGTLSGDPEDYVNDATGINGAVAFSNNAYAQFPDINSRYNFSGEDAQFKVEAYVKSADFSTGSTRVVMTKVDDANNELWFIGVDGLGGIICAVYTNDYQFFETGSLGSPVLLTDGAWNKIACSYDSSTGTLSAYLDDEEVHSEVVSGDWEIPTSDSPVYINGYPPTGDGGFNGSIDEVTIYNAFGDPEPSVTTITMTTDSQLRTTQGNFVFSGSATGTEAISTVEWSVHSANSWTACTATDGTFDETTDGFNCNIASGSTDGTFYYDIRASDISDVLSTVSPASGLLDTATRVDFWFNFDNLTDAGHHNGDSVSLGAISSSGAPALTNGELGDKAITFNGTSRYSVADPSAYLDISGSTAVYNLTFRIKPSTSMLGDYGMVVQKMKNGSDGQWDVLVDTEGHIMSRHHVEGGGLAIGEGSSRTQLTMDDWNDVVLTWDYANRVVSMRVNGGLAETSVWTIPDYQASSAFPVYIGDSSASDQGFIGEIDDIVFNRTGDAGAPIVTIDSLEDSSRVTDNTPSFDVNFTDATGISSAEYFFSATTIGNLDTQSWNSIATPTDGAWGGTSEDVTITASTIADGNMTLYVRSVDALGNQNLYSRGGGQQWQHFNVTSKYVMPFYSFIVEAVDTTAPRIYANAVTPDPTIDKAPAIRGFVKDYLVLNQGDTASNIASILYKIDSGDFVETDPFDGTFDSTREDFYIQIPSLLSDGAHTIQIRAVDASGNTTEDGTVGEDLGDYLLNFNVTSSGILETSSVVTKDVTFDDHDLHDTIFSNAVWGNGVVRLRQEIEFNSARDYVPANNDHYGYTYGEVHALLFDSIDGNIWIGTHNGALLYYNIDTQTVTDYGTLRNIGQQVSAIFEFEESDNRYLAISFNNSGSSMIYDINNTPENIGDDPGFADLGTKVGFDEYERTTFYATDSRTANLSLFGTFSGTTDEVIRLDLAGTVMDVSDDTYVVWGHDHGLGDNSIGVYNSDATSFYFDEDAHIFIMGSYAKGIFVCDDANTPTNQGDDECGQPFGYPAGTQQGRIFSIIKDPNGWYWLGGDNGIARVDINGTADQEDDDFVAVMPAATIGSDRVADIKWIEGETPVGDEIWAITREGRIRAIEYNSTYDDTLDDTHYSYKIPQFEYQSGGGTSFYMQNRNTIWNVVSGQGLIKTTLTRSFEESNTIEIYPDPPAGLLEVDNVSLDQVIGSVSIGSAFTLGELTTFEVSNDAGLTWDPMEIGSTINFTTSDYKLKLRITLNEGSTPILESLRLVYTAQPQGTIAAAESGSGDSSGSGSSSSGVSGATECTSQAPTGNGPWLYAAIPDGDNSITLYFTEAGDPVDRYVLQYGSKSGEAEWGALNIGGKGTRTYTVSALSPNTTYYFKVRGGNGCATGAWSNEISASTKVPTGAALISDVLNNIRANVITDITTGISALTPDIDAQAQEANDQDLENETDTEDKSNKGMLRGQNLIWLSSILIALLVLVLFLIAKRRKKEKESSNTTSPDLFN